MKPSAGLFNLINKLSNLLQETKKRKFSKQKQKHSMDVFNDGQIKFIS